MGAALNDLAYAVNDTIKDPENFKPLNELIQDMITELKNIVNDVNVAVANANTAISNVNTTVGKVNTNLAGGKVPIVRKIQRGTFTQSGDITLSGFTNLNKMIVLLNGNGVTYETGSTSSYAYARNAYVQSLTVSKLTVYLVKGYFDYDDEGTHSYQVIEFW